MELRLVTNISSTDFENFIGRIKKMKKIILGLIFVMLFSVNLMACGTDKTDSVSGKIQVVATIFPEYDWVSKIIGENNDHVDLTLLIDNGADLHSYQPTAEDILKISTCDLFIYVGGESDAWVDDALSQATNDDMIVINLLDVIGDNAKEEELKEGMQAEEEEDDADAEEAEYDEHVWLSLRNASIICDEIANALISLDGDHADSFKANLEAYKKELAELDAEYELCVNQAANKTLLFADRFPFRYLTEDYGLDYYAAFIGCSAETEASFETVAFLAGKIDELSLKHVIVIESGDAKFADSIIKSSKAGSADVLTLNSMQTVNKSDIENGADYLDIMKSNLEVLKTALS